MKQFLFLPLFILLISMASFGQNNSRQTKFTLKGEMMNKDTGKLVLRFIDTDERWKSDTAILVNGKFSLTGIVDVVSPATITFPDYNSTIGDPNICTFFLEPGLTYIYFDSSLAYGRFDGSATQRQYTEYVNEQKKTNSKWKKISEERLALVAESQDLPEESDRAKIVNARLLEIAPQIRKHNDAIEKLNTAFIHDHPNSYISAYLLASLRRRPRLEFVENFYNNLDEDIKSSRYGRYLKNEITQRRLVAVGQMVPDFTAKTSSGKFLTLSELRGRVILLDFWASWCLPCRDEMPELKSYQTKYRSKNFEVVAISIDRKESDWLGAVQEDGLTGFHNVLRNDEINKNYENVYRPIPSQILINEKGIIIWKSENGVTSDNNTLQIVLQQIFSE